MMLSSLFPIAEDWRVRSYPTDLLFGFAYLAVTTSVVLTSAGPSLLRTALGVPLLAFLPGYAIVAALFPASGGDQPTTARSRVRHGVPEGEIDLAERLALSFGVSVAVIPLFALTMSVLGLGLSLEALVGTLALVSSIGLLVGMVRRARLPHERRFRLPVTGAINRAKAAIGGARSTVDGALNVVLALSILLAASTLAYGLLTPSVAETDTSMVLMTESGDGDLVASGYPGNLTRGESTTLVAAIKNTEGERVDYTLVVQLQRVASVDDSLVVEERQQVVRRDRTVPATETWHANTTVSPSMTGTDLRLTYLLYRGPAPRQPTVESSYRQTHVWINVTGER